MTNRRQISDETRRINRRYEDKYFPLVRRVLEAELNAVIAVIERSGIQAAISYVNTHIHSKGLPTVIEQLYREVGLRYARRTWIDFTAQARNHRKPGKSISDQVQTKGFGFNAQWVRWIKEFLYKNLIEKITFEVARTTREIMLTILNRAIAEGWGVDETVKNMEALPFTRTQSARIVRTEITRATNTGIMAAGDTYEWQQSKEWIAAMDDRTRGNPVTGQRDHASHWDLDGVTINREEYYTDPRSGEKLLFPGDPNAGPGDTINCRCVIALVTKVDANGRLIPKENNQINVLQ